MKMYKHARTHVVHRLTDGTIRNSISSGLKLSDDYVQVDPSRFLDFRKCKRCEVYLNPLKMWEPLPVLSRNSTSKAAERRKRRVRPSGLPLTVFLIANLLQFSHDSLTPQPFLVSKHRGHLTSMLSEAEPLKLGFQLRKPTLWSLMV